MNLPKIDIETLPNLETASGLFGSLSDLATGRIDDRVVVVMTYVYETLPTF